MTCNHDSGLMVTFYGPQGVRVNCHCGAAWFGLPDGPSVPRWASLAVDAALTQAVTFPESLSRTAAA